MPLHKFAPVAAILFVAGCGASSGIVPVGPDTYALSEMRAEAIGGGARAQDVALNEASGFCQRQGRSLALLNLQPGGDPRSDYWPTASTVTFRCSTPSSSAVDFSSGRPLRQ